MIKKEVSEKVKNYIIECINDVYEPADEGKTEQDFLKDYYEQVKFNKTGRMKMYDAVVHTVRGLYKGFDYETYKINEIVSNWIAADLDNIKAEELFYDLIAKESLNLFETLN